MKKTLLLIATAISAGVMTSGCSWLNPGEEEFACSGMPGSVFCHSARDVYERTNSGLVPSPINGNTYNEDCTDCVRAEDENPELRDMDGDGVPETASGRSYRGSDGKTLDVTDDEIINNYVTPNLPTRPVPVRTPAQIMRIWVGPYVDSNGDLVAPGIVYTEIEPRKWIYPGQVTEDGQTNDRIMRPLAQRSTYKGGKTPSTYTGGPDEDFSALTEYGVNQGYTQQRLNKNRTK